jgi:hypothetical protein
MSTRSNRAGRTPSRGRGREVQPKRSNRWLWAPLVLLGAIIVAAVAVYLFNQTPSDLTGVQTFPNQVQTHVETPQTYNPAPPVGGPHSQAWLNCGIYDQPVPNENAVHSMEHGAVWVTYRPDLPAADVETLRGLLRGHRYGLLSPYPDIPSPVVASAWGVQLRLDSVSDPRLASFIEKYENGSQTPEPGASCRGGRGSPIQ